MEAWQRHNWFKVKTRQKRRIKDEIGQTQHGQSPKPFLCVWSPCGRWCIIRFYLSWWSGQLGKRYCAILKLTWYSFQLDATLKSLKKIVHFCNLDRDPIRVQNKCFLSQILLSYLCDCGNEIKTHSILVKRPLREIVYGDLARQLCTDNTSGNFVQQKFQTYFQFWSWSALPDIFLQEMVQFFATL